MKQDHVGRIGSRSRALGEPRRATAEWLPVEVERLRVSRIVLLPEAQVKSILRIEPQRFLAFTYGGETSGSGSTPVILSPSRSQRWLRIPAQVEFWTPDAEHRAATISVRWKATRFDRYFPVMEANLFVHASGDGESELLLEGRYRPPLGLFGLIGDRIIGRWIAAATVEHFIDAVAITIEREWNPAAAAPDALAKAS
jgi:hypothetical protein